MVVGDPGIWADRFRSFDIRLLERIATVWPDCLAVLPEQPVEDDITLNLVTVLSKDDRARRLFHWLEFHFEPTGYLASGAVFSKGQIDIAAFLDQDRERYLAYECKRLNVINAKGARSSLATEYVKQGVKRFVTEQYAEGLPLGCMLGYVMDGDVSFATSRVHTALADNASEVNLKNGPTSATAIELIERFTTNHLRKAGSHEIEVWHAMLPFPEKS